MTVIRNTSGRDRSNGHGPLATVAQPDGAAIVHVGESDDDVLRLAAVSWAIEHAQAFDQVVLSERPDAERRLAELGAGAMRRLRADSGNVAELQQTLEHARCIAVLVHSGGEAGLSAALAAARAGISVVRLGGDIGDDGAARAIASLADIQLVFSEDDAATLRSRYPAERIHVVGNPVVDAVRRFAQPAVARAAWRPLGLQPGGYVLACEPVSGLAELSARERLVIESATDRDVRPAGARVVRAPDYLDHLSLLRAAGAVVTSSVRVRDEAAALGVHCYAASEQVPPLAGRPAPQAIPLWDGRAGARVARVLVANFARVRVT